MLKMPLKPISTTYKQMYSIIIVHDSFRHFWGGQCKHQPSLSDFKPPLRYQSLSLFSLPANAAGAETATEEWSNLSPPLRRRLNCLG